MPQSPIGWILTICVPFLVVAVVLTLLGSTTRPDVVQAQRPDVVQAQAAAVCSGAQRALKQVQQSPGSVAEGLEIEHRALAIYMKEVSQLRELATHAGKSFRAGLADDQSLLAGLSSMLARPDFVKLSLTLPGHPSLAPNWLRRWIAHEQALLADARSQFSRAGIPGCEKSLG